MSILRRIMMRVQCCRSCWRNGMQSKAVDRQSTGFFCCVRKEARKADLIRLESSNVWFGSEAGMTLWYSVVVFLCAFSKPNMCLCKKRRLCSVAYWYSDSVSCAYPLWFPCGHVHQLSYDIRETKSRERDRAKKKKKKTGRSY